MVHCTSTAVLTSLTSFVVACNFLYIHVCIVVNDPVHLHRCDWFICNNGAPSLVQSSRSIPLFLYNLDDKSLFHRSRNSGREFVGWNQLLCRSILTPISCKKFKIYSTFLVQFGRQIYISLQLCFDFWWFFFHLNSKRNLSPNISSLHDADWSLERPLEWLLLL